MFTKLLCGLILPHLSHSFRMKQFSSENLERLRIELYLLLFYKFIYGFCDLFTVSARFHLIFSIYVKMLKKLTLNILSGDSYHQFFSSTKL